MRPRGWDDVRRIALALPETSERTSRGWTHWRVRDKLFVWERPLLKTDLRALGDDAPSGPILGVRTESLEAKEAMLASAPNLFFTIPHFNGYPAVLVRLSKIGARRLEDVIVEAWIARAPKRLAQEFLEAHPPRRR